MLDFILQVFTDKHVFTRVILTLYACQFMFQFLVTKDYDFGGYWLCAFGITIFAMRMSN